MAQRLENANKRLKRQDPDSKDQSKFFNKFVDQNKKFAEEKFEKIHEKLIIYWQRICKEELFEDLRNQMGTDECGPIPGPNPNKTHESIRRHNRHIARQERYIMDNVCELCAADPAPYYNLSLDFELVDFIKKYDCKFSLPHICKLIFDLGLFESAKVLYEKYYSEIKYDLNAPNEFDLTPINMACLRGNHRMVKWLCQNCARLDEFSMNNTVSPLVVMLNRSRLCMVKMLISYGADVDIPFQKQTPLLYYCHLHDKKMVEYFIDHGANINGASNVTAIEKVIAGHFFNGRKHGVELINYLLTKSPKPIPFKAGSNILDIMDGKYSNGEKLTEIEILRLLYESGLIEEYIEEFRNSPHPIALAIERDSTNMAELFIRMGKDVNERIPFGTHPFEMAMRKKEFRLAKILVAAQKIDLAKERIDELLKMKIDEPEKKQLCKFFSKDSYNLRYNCRVAIRSYLGKAVDQEIANMEIFDIIKSYLHLEMLE